MGFGSGYDVCFSLSVSCFNVECDINRRFSSYGCVCVTVVNGYQGKPLILTVSVVEILHITGPKLTASSFSDYNCIIFVSR